MSKRLIKILAISLICIMIPAAIVVSVVCVAAAQTYELAITTLGTIENVGSITYKVDDEVLEDKAQIRKDADVTVVAEAEGYNFIGWFTESEELLSSESEYTFKMTGAETLYAKFDVIKYNITYKLDEEVIGNVEDVMWGSNLLVLEERKADEGLAFAGWKKGTDTKVYTSAKFGKETDVELLASFEEIKYMISYNGAEAVEVAWGDELTAGSNDIANGNLFLNWKKGETACPIEEGKEVAKFGVVKEVINLVPAYEKIVYNVSYDGAESVVVTWGTALSEAPEKTGYTFKGWKVSAASDPIMIAVFGYNAEDPEAVIALTSDYQINKYTITWVVGDTTTTTEVKYNEKPTFETPTKAANAQYTYTFNKWSPEVVEATADATYTAEFTSTVNKYTVLWVVEGTTVETDENVEYGTTPTYDGTTPEKAATAEYTYTFDKWTPAIEAITGDTTYTAEFTSTINIYTITWNIEGATTTEDVKYGEVPEYKGTTPTKASANGYVYTFTGWDPEIVAVEGIATYTAQFDETNLYESAYKSVKFILAEGDWAEVDGVKTITVYNANIYDATAENNITISEKIINNEVVDNELKYGDFSELKLFDTDALANLQSINEKTTETNYNQYNIKGIRFYFGTDENAYYTITADTTVADVIALAFDCGALTTASNGYGTDLVLDIGLVYAA